MKHAALAVLGAIAPAAWAYDGTQKPIQTFFLPLPEESVFNNMFKMINRHVAAPPVESFVSVSMSTDNTVIWYDHWEGGYEADVTKPTMAKTEIWGDGDKSNGCAPSVSDCTDANDKLMAGDVVVIQNSVSLPRNPSEWSGIRYDGGDMLKASFPVAITRGAYPKEPGSLMAGGVEVLDVDNWGYEFIAPIGSDKAGDNPAFEYSAMFFMAAYDDTEVIMPNGETRILNKGGGYHALVNMGDKIKSNKPIQVDFIIGDENSQYELRWYSLIAVEAWTNDYTSPMGDSVGKTKALLYNPSDSDIQVEMTYLDRGKAKTVSTVVPKKSYKMSNIIPSGSGAQFKSIGEKPFIALSMTDTEKYTGGSRAQQTDGQWYDWGFPIVPTRLLTPQVLIGWGYGCTNNSCEGQADRSVVWLTAVDNADIYIDYQNTGKDYEKRTVSKLQGIQVKDPKDQDMSGAVIFATQPNSGPDGPPVDIAAAWGQDPAVSKDIQRISMDLGTVVLPFTGVRVSKVADKTEVGPGEVLRYTIRVVNVGQADIKAGDYSIVDPQLPSQSYVPGSTTYSTDAGLTVTAVPDDTTGETPFPLDEDGLPNKHDLLRRGGTHEISFDVIVDKETLNTNNIPNTGYLLRKTGTKLPFETATPVKFSPDIRIDNTVCLGHDDGACCDNAEEMQTGAPYTKVTYCYKVTNTGNTYLKNPYITNPDLESKHEKNDYIMAPGDSYTIYYDVGQDSGKTPVVIMDDLKNTATVSADPVFATGDVIDPKQSPVRHSDPSEVQVIDFEPDIKIENTVFTGDGSCSVNGAELASGLMQTPVTYCFKVTNTGNTYLKNVKVLNEDLPGDKYENQKPELVAPGESFILTVDHTIDGNYTNMAYVHGEPALPDGTPLTMYKNVFDEDPSGIEGREPQTRSGDKDVFVPPPIEDTPTLCMTPHWRDAGNTQPLICKAEDITIKSLKSDRASCNEGETIKITATADLLFTKPLYDPAWFVATDGGDAKLGTCVLKGLTSGTDITVASQDGSTLDVGTVTWNDDADNDKCGDVLIPSGTAVVSCPFLVEAEMKCIDSNDDGTLDFEVCFSWREESSNGKCTLTNDDIDTIGALADVYPANNMKCNCVRAELPTVTVERKSSDDPLSVC